MSRRKRWSRFTEWSWPYVASRGAPPMMMVRIHGFPKVGAEGQLTRTSFVVPLEQAGRWMVGQEVQITIE